jgi:hypothetical protein
VVLLLDCGGRPRLLGLLSDPAGESEECGAVHVVVSSGGDKVGE